MLSSEADNFRAALSWSMSDPSGVADSSGGSNFKPVAALRLSSALSDYWYTKGELAEGRAWMTRALARRECATKDAQASALTSAGMLALQAGDFDDTRQLLTDALHLASDDGDDRAVGLALVYLGRLELEVGDYPTALSDLDESLKLLRPFGDGRGIANALTSKASICINQHDYDDAEPLIVESLAISRDLGDLSRIGNGLYNLGRLARCRQDYSSAVEFYEQSLAISRELDETHGMLAAINGLGVCAGSTGDLRRCSEYFENCLLIAREKGLRSAVAWSLHNIAFTQLQRGDFEAARSAIVESLELMREMGDRRGFAGCLKIMGALAIAGDQAALAAQLYAAGMRQDSELGLTGHPAYMDEHLSDFAAMKESLGDSGFAAEWSWGESLAIDEAVAYALGELTWDELASRVNDRLEARERGPDGGIPTARDD
jgi:tetratricopeptide (TPR) repeat protein